MGIVASQMSQSSEWVAWVGPARKGDAAAIERLEQYFAPFVHAVLLSRLSHKKAGTLVKPVLADTVFRLGGLSNDAGFGAWLLLAARECILGRFAIGDVTGCAEPLDHLSVLINNRHGVGQSPTDGAIGTQDSMLEREK